MFTAFEEKQIARFHQSISQDITISLIDSEHQNSLKFHTFCDALTQLAPKIKVAIDDSSPQPSPQILIGNGLRYQAIPSGHELQPFLEALAILASNSPKIADSILERLKENQLPATLTVFIAPHCTFCPQIVGQLIPVSMVDDNVQLIIIDGTLFPKLAQNNKIQSVPTILLDNQFRWTGSVPLEEIIDAVNTRDPVSLGAFSLESIVKEGRAGDLANMMMDSKKIFPAFYDLLTHEKWPVRLGAMVVIEEISAINPKLASEVIHTLWDRFHQVADQIKGDILYMFGEIRDRRTVLWLESVLTGKYNADVKEAANEALEKLNP